MLAVERGEFRSGEGDHLVYLRYAVLLLSSFLRLLEGISRSCLSDPSCPMRSVDCQAMNERLRRDNVLQPRFHYRNHSELMTGNVLIVPYNIWTMYHSRCLLPNLVEASPMSYDLDVANGPRSWRESSAIVKLFRPTTRSHQLSLHLVYILASRKIPRYIELDLRA